MLSALINLSKPRILGLIVLSSVAMAIVAARGSLTWQTGILLTVSGSLASAGAAFLNNYFDRDIDVLMERTKNRPLPAGRISPRIVLIAGLVLVAAAVPVALRQNGLVALFMLGGALIYGLLYTLWLKRRTSLNIVIGGLSGSCAVLAGWFAVTSSISAVPLMVALIVFLWTPSHFWGLALAHQESYRQAGVPMLPVLVGTKKTINYMLLSTVLLVAVSLLTWLVGHLHQIYLIGALALGTVFLTANLMLWHHPTRRLAWLNFKLSGFYLLGLFHVLMLDVLV